MLVKPAPRISLSIYATECREILFLDSLEYCNQTKKRRAGMFCSRVTPSLAREHDPLLQQQLCHRPLVRSKTFFSKIPSHVYQRRSRFPQSCVLKLDSHHPNHLQQLRKPGGGGLTHLQRVYRRNTLQWYCNTFCTAIFG